MLTIALILLFTLLCVALSDDRAWDNATRSVRNALVFEGRHREYGAYELRRDYDRRFGMALLTALGITGGLIGLAFAFSGKASVIPKPPISIEVDLTQVIDPPPVHPNDPPPAPKTSGSTSPTPTPQPDPTGFVEADSMDTKLVTDTTTIAPVAPGPGAGPGTGPVAPGGSGTGPDPGPFIPFLGTEATVQFRPEFPGGETAMFKWVRDHIQFPESNVEKEKVYVQFTVDVDGSVIDVKAVKGEHRAFIEEAVRVIKRMPKWKAARMGEQDVPCRLVLPISFEVHN
ncbi:MAG TPA: energy transducer TonB [Flavobacteriales bacterium]